ncbi:MAG: hypothetical protein ACPG19_02480 [Saprospiraceae bacterium]
MKPFILTILALSIFVTSCENMACGYSKDSFLSNFDKLVTKAKESDRKISDNAWERDDKIFEQMVISCYEQYETELSLGEKRDFWVGSIQYLIHRYGWGLLEELRDSDTQNEIISIVRENAMETLNGIDEIVDIVKDELKNNSKLRNLMDELGNELNNIFNKLKE